MRPITVAPPPTRMSATMVTQAVTRMRYWRRSL
jgi:hypothetical protein